MRGRIASIFCPTVRSLVIDAKFPLEAVTAFREAKSDDERKLATARVRTDIAKHVGDIAAKYLIPGETQDMALMFVPSESVYAELYDSFDDVFQKAYRAKVIIVSPSLLMLAIQVIQQIRRDAQHARGRRARSAIEVGHVMKDVSRLRDRVENCKAFRSGQQDIKNPDLRRARSINRGERIRGRRIRETSRRAPISLPARPRKLGSRRIAQ